MENGDDRRVDVGAPSHLYKYRGTGLEYLVHYLEGGFLYAAHPAELNDPFEYSRPGYSCHDLIGAIAGSHDPKQRGVVSLSEDPLNELLWAHYGGQHCGFCLQFEASACQDLVDGAKILRLARVKYDDDRSTDPDPDSRLLHKSRPWAYEREWRILTKKPKERVAGFRPTGVIFGMRADDELEAAVRVAAKWDPDLRFGRVEQTAASFALRIRWDDDDAR